MFSASNHHHTYTSPFISSEATLKEGSPNIIFSKKSIQYNIAKLSSIFSPAEAEP